MTTKLEARIAARNPRPMADGSTKLAQSARGTKTCQRCGRTKPLDTWPIHARFKKPLNICNGCLAESRMRADQKNRERQAAKRAERERAAAVAAAASEPRTDAPAPRSGPSSVALLIAKLDGYALAKDDAGLMLLIDALREAVGDDG